MTDIKIKIKDVHPSAYRPNEWARVTGVEMCLSPGRVPMPCFQLTYSDGETVLIPLYEIATVSYVIEAADEVSPEKTAERLRELQKLSHLKETQQRLAALEERVTALEAQSPDELVELKEAFIDWQHAGTKGLGAAWQKLNKLMYK